MGMDCKQLSGIFCDDLIGRFLPYECGIFPHVLRRTRIDITTMHLKSSSHQYCIYAICIFDSFVSYTETPRQFRANEMEDMYSCRVIQFDIDALRSISSMPTQPLALATSVINLNGRI